MACLRSLARCSSATFADPLGALEWLIPHAPHAAEGATVGDYLRATREVESWYETL
jgi:hypothetical protein